MFDNLVLGSFLVFLVEVLILAGIFYYAKFNFIPSFFSNINKKIEKENINKANKSLYMFSAATFIYIVAEFFGMKLYFLHIVAAIIFAMFVKNIIHPISLKRWGKESFSLKEIESEELFSYLSENKSESNTIEYEGKTYLFRGEKFHEKIPTKRDTPKSKFWEGFLSLMVWTFLVLNLIYILKVDLKAPEVLLTLAAFIVAYVISPFYPDLYSTYVLAKDEENDFGTFVEVRIGDKSYFGSIEKLTFFKAQIKDWYNKTYISFFHKTYMGGVITSYPNGRIVEKEYVVGSGDEAIELVSSLKEWLKDFNSDKFDTPTVTFFDHNYGYGVKMRVLVKAKYLKEYGSLKDQITSHITTKSNENEIDLRTPILEVQINNEEVKQK